MSLEIRAVTPDLWPDMVTLFERRGTRGLRTKFGRNQDRQERRGWRLWLRRALVWGGAAFGLALLALFLAVFFATRELPSYSQLMASQNGQTIVVRARDGTEIVALGPSYGEWLSSDEIPQVMKDAMVSVEDRRFYSHPGVDPIGLVRAFWVAFRDDPNQTLCPKATIMECKRTLRLSSWAQTTIFLHPTSFYQLTASSNAGFRRIGRLPCVPLRHRQAIRSLHQPALACLRTAVRPCGVRNVTA